MSQQLFDGLAQILVETFMTARGFILMAVHLPQEIGSFDHRV